MPDPGVEAQPGGNDVVAGVLASLKPMGDLRRFLIEDLTSEEEDVFFGALKNA